MMTSSLFETTTACAAVLVLDPRIRHGDGSRRIHARARGRRLEQGRGHHPPAPRPAAGPETVPRRHRVAVARAAGVLPGLPRDAAGLVAVWHPGRASEAPARGRAEPPGGFPDEGD